MTKSVRPSAAHSTSTRWPKRHPTVHELISDEPDLPERPLSEAELEHLGNHALAHMKRAHPGRKFPGDRG